MFEREYERKALWLARSGSGWKVVNVNVRGVAEGKGRWVVKAVSWEWGRRKVDESLYKELKKDGNLLTQRLLDYVEFVTSCHQHITCKDYATAAQLHRTGEFY